MSDCPHGESGPHGEVGKDWCAGPADVGPYDAWRSQLEFQMNAPSFGPIILGRQADLLRSIGYSYNGSFVMYEKPGEYVSMPVVPQ